MFAKRLPIEKTIAEKLKSGKTELYIAFGTLLGFEEQPRQKAQSSTPAKYS